MTIKSFIEKAIEGGWNPKPNYYMPWMNTLSDNGITLSGGEGDQERYSINQIILSPSAWQAVGKVEGWETSKYRACEMKMPFYHNEKMRGTGVIVGESRDKKQWYIRWDRGQNGRPTKGQGMRNPYPKENIIEKSKTENWNMVMHRMLDALIAGKTIEEYLATL